ncbi:unnamed protein product, partial [Ectocarpus sp. 13 AM-2016]
PPSQQVPPLIPHHAQRRGMSFDANASGRRDHHHNDTGSARGSSALPRTPAAAAAADDERDAAAAAAAVAALGGEAAVTASVVAAFTPRPPPPPPVAGQGSYGVGSGGRDGNEQRIPEYVPPQKQGSLSKATHRRSSSRGSAVVGCGGEGGGGSGAAAATRSGSVGRSASPPDSSPFFSVRTPPKVLPPVPAFAGGAGAGLAGDDCGNDGLAAQPQPQPPPPPPPPSSWNEDQLEGVVILGGDGGGATEAGLFEAEPLPAPPPPAVVENGLQAGGYGRPPGAAGGALLLSPKRRGSGMPISPVPFASDKRSTAAPTTPKQGSSRRRRRQQQQQRDGDEDPPSGRGSSFFAGPSPDGLDNSFSHIDYVAGFVADGIAAAAVGGGSDRKEAAAAAAAAAAAFERQRDERAAISVLPASPAWSADDDVNRGTGVRRRVSPRASAAAAAAAAGAGAGAAAAVVVVVVFALPAGAPVGSRSRRRKDGVLRRAPTPATISSARWPSPSPTRRRERLPPRLRAGGPPPKSSGSMSGSSGRGAPSPTAATAVHSPRRLPPGRRLRWLEPTRRGPVSTEEDTESQVGLRCSAPIYDRGRNLLGNKEPGGGGESARAAAQAPTEKRGGLAGRRANADGEGVGVAAGDLCAIKDAGENDKTLAAESVVPGSPVLEDSVTANAKLTEVPQASSAHGEHVRPGRDLNSSQAFAASLDLPFDQLELSELIGGGGFGQV